MHCDTAPDLAPVPGRDRKPINDKSYVIDKPPEAAKVQMVSLQFVDSELARHNATVAVFQTAGIGNLNALKPHLAAIDAGNLEPKH